MPRVEARRVELLGHPHRPVGVRAGATLDRLAAADRPPERRAELARIAEVLERQAPQVRLCWVLRRVQGCTLPEVAAAPDLSLATVKRRIAVADRALARQVEP